jgi:hypothetical protein
MGGDGEAIEIVEEERHLASCRGVRGVGIPPRLAIEGLSRFVERAADNHAAILRRGEAL